MGTAKKVSGFAKEFREELIKSRSVVNESWNRLHRGLVKATENVVGRTKEGRKLQEEKCIERTVRKRGNISKEKLSKKQKQYD